MWISLGIFIICGYITYKVLSQWFTKCSDAPVPLGWPILGNALDFDIKAPMDSLMKWAKELGDVYQINLMGNKIVVANGEAIYDVLVTKSEIFAGRPWTPRFDWIFHGDLVFRDNDATVSAWRKLIHHQIKQYGTGMKYIEDIVTDEIQDTIKYIAQRNGQPFDPEDDIHTTVANLVMTLMVGERLGRDDPLLARMRLAERLLVEASGAGEGVELDMLPWLKYLNIPSYKKITDFNNLRDSIINEWIDKQKVDLDRNNIRGLIDMFLVAQQDNADTVAAMTDLNLKMVTQNVWMGGTVTTANTMYAALTIILNHPHIQKKLQQQIDEVLDDGRLPKLEDRASLPYVDAFILELGRYITLLPFAVPHKAMEDTTIGGYSIPKDTQIWVNLFGLHHDERFFPEPDVFKPERFLDEDGCVIPPIDRKLLMPFSAGRRVCLGEQFARARLFLFITSLLQKFNFEPEDKMSLPKYQPREYSLGIVLRAESYRLRAIPRSG